MEFDEDFVLAAKDAIWENVGIERDSEGLERTLTDLKEIGAEINLCPYSPIYLQTTGVELCETLNMLNVAWIITQASLFRTESRGGHYRSDFPDQDDTNWLQRIIMTKDNEPEIVEL